jgi:hypothetical protein
MNCFYCGEDTHSVAQCVNPGILNLYERLTEIHLETRLTRVSALNQQQFTSVIQNMMFNDIISVAIKYTNASYPNSVIITDDYYTESLWYHFENKYLSYMNRVITDLADNANVYFINGPIINNRPNSNIINRNNNINSPIIQRQRHLRLRNGNSRKKYNFITTIETEKYNEHQEEECPICLDDVKCIKIVKLNCSHKFCVSCVIKSIKSNRKHNYECALCRCKAESVRVYNADVYDLVRQL